MFRHRGFLMSVGFVNGHALPRVQKAAAMHKTCSFQVIATALVVVLALASIAAGQQQRENLAKGCAYTMQPAPNYGYCP